jgi:hypothetical protein
MCKEKDFDSLASLEMQTWCGGLDSKDKPDLVCEISDSQDTTHYLELENTKTYDRKIEIKGQLLNGRAKFEAEEATVNTAGEWEHQLDLLGSATERVKAAKLCKITNKSGSEWVDLELKYDHQWTPNVMKTANTAQLRLQIKVT